jgi:HEAT repeat protein
MIKGDKRWWAAGAGFVLVGLAVFMVVHHGRDRKTQSGAGEEGGTRWRGFAAGVPGLPASNGEPAAAAEAAKTLSPEALQEQVDTAMAAWRNAIVLKDADAVVTLDRVFNQMPARYAPALIKAAETDENERVRAFSVRVLGNYKAAALAELFSHLLEDRSPYVRQNAAWALGELVARPEGREAAQRALAELRRLEQHDTARDVRAAAGSALERLR